MIYNIKKEKLIGLIKPFIAPLGFIILSGSAFVFIKLGVQNSTLMAFLELRFLVAFFVLCLVVVLFKVKLPKSFKEIFHIAVAGILSVGLFSFGCFSSIKYGISPALCSLIISLQPIVVSFFAIKFLGEKVNKKAWLGLILGFLGVVLVLGLNEQSLQTQLAGVLLSMLGLLSISFGSLYQKKFCSNMNLVSGGAIQTFFSALLILPFLYFEETKVVFNSDFIIALLYMAVIASIGAMSFLYYMIRYGEVSKVSSLFYLLPIVSVIVTFIIFGKEMDMNIFLGIFVVLIAMNLINKKDVKPVKKSI